MKKKLKFLVVAVQYLVAWTQKIIWNSKVYIIHKFGGYTKKEYRDHAMSVKTRTYDYGYKCGFESGIKHLATKLELIATQNYGCSKQKWIDKIYNEIKSNI